MKAYSIFDDFPEKQRIRLEQKGITVTVQEKGAPRPSGEKLGEILEEYDVIMISTAQKMPEEMFAKIEEKKIIATASIGVDHICVPVIKKELVKIVNAPVANRISVAEHTFGLILALAKQFFDGRNVAALGKSKKEMQQKPRDLFGATIGVVGAGGTATAVLEMAKSFGMKRLAWTRSPQKHTELAKDGVMFTDLDFLLENADVISVNLPLNNETKNLISADKIKLIKDDGIFISTSRSEITDNEALFCRAKSTPTFSIGLDMDAESVYGLWDRDRNNIIVTPHIAGGTVESRRRLFNEITESILEQTR